MEATGIEEEEEEEEEDCENNMDRMNAMGTGQSPSQS
jgi:hypothetical protein